MNKQIIRLKPLAEIGTGSAEVTDDEIKIETSGINGGLKAWLIGGIEAEAVGNLVEGRLYKRANTLSHNGILITQSGKQMLIGYYENDSVKSEKKITAFEEKPPFSVSGYKWRKITDRDFSGMNDAVKFILSNTSVYECFKKYGYYWIGENGGLTALAFRCCETDKNPLAFLGNPNTVRDGYCAVGINSAEKKLFIL